MTPPTKPPQAILSELINAYWKTFSIVAAAELGIADLIGDEPQAVSTLAEKSATHPPSLYRLLRALASLGIFVEDDAGRFANTPLSATLRSGASGSLRGLARLSGRMHLRAWPEILHSLRTGETAFHKVFGAELFDHVGRDAELARIFDEAFSGYTAAIGYAVVGAYDFSRFRLVVDVGGGSGALLAAIADAAPDTRGINFDLPHVAARAERALQHGERLRSLGGDFFEAVPVGGDAYTMKMILHDWNDARSIVILKNVRRAIMPDGKLLVIEAVLPPGNAPSLGKLLDVNMLVMTGGRERTEEEFRALLAAGGFALERVVVAHPSASVIEARPV
jgi:SAM-dependent methyltransferase